jgi:hypothetical protein
MRIVKTLGVAVLGSLLFSAPALGAAARTGGAVQVFVTPSANGGSGGGTFLITGAIADYGKTVKVNSAGKADKKGTDSDLVLKKGTILVDVAQVNTAINNANPTNYDATTCSASFVVTAPVPIISGTKAYVGISGSVNVTETLAFILPFTKSGKCNTNANPVDAWATVTGAGTVSFG